MDAGRKEASAEGNAETSVRRNAALALLCAAQFMVVLDASIVNVALPSMGEALGLSQTDLSWVVNAYAIFFGSFLLLGGRAGDLFGLRRLFIGGLLLFTLASLGGGLAQTGWMLIAARAFQGLAAAVVAPSVLSLITTTFAEGEERNWALGIYGAVAAAGFSAGVLLGGVLTQLVSWRWVLFVNVPIGAGAAALAPTLLEESRDPSAARGLDLTGAATVTAGLVALVYGLSEAEHAGWGSPQTLGALAGGLALITLFVWIESRSHAPLVRLGIFQKRTLTGANLVGFFFGATVGPMLFILTLHMQNVLGYSPIETGLAFLPHALTVVVASQVVSRLTGRFGVRWCMAAGTGVLAGGFALLAAGLSPEGAYLGVLLPGTVLAGVGVAFMIVTGSIAATAGVADEEQGLASGLFNTAQQVGLSLGLAVFVAVSAARSGGAGAGGAAAQVGGFRGALWAGLVFAVAACLSALLVVREKATAASGGESEAAEIPA